MKHLQKNIIPYALAIVFLVSAGGSLLLAQTYTWAPIGLANSLWSLNGLHAYNTNAGSVVVGAIEPSGKLLLDVAGQMGATEYCNEEGADCFQAQDMKWRLSGDNMISINTGNIGINQPDPVEQLDVGGNIRADAFLYSSDEQYKENIKTLSGALDMIGEIRGVRFTWKDSGENDIGVIAQEVEKALPEVVHTDSQGRKSVDYARMVALLIQAVKEQERRINELLRTVDELLSELDKPH